MRFITNDDPKELRLIKIQKKIVSGINVKLIMKISNKVYINLTVFDTF